MASKLSLSDSAYSKIERNEADLTIARIYDIAKILDVHYSKILEFDSKYLFENVSNAQIGSGENHNHTVTDLKPIYQLIDMIQKQIENQNLLIREIFDRKQAS